MFCHETPTTKVLPIPKYLGEIKDLLSTAAKNLLRNKNRVTLLNGIIISITQPQSTIKFLSALAECRSLLYMILQHAMTGSIVLAPVYNEGERGKGQGAMDRKDRWPMAEVKLDRLFFASSNMIFHIPLLCTFERRQLMLLILWMARRAILALM